MNTLKQPITFLHAESADFKVADHSGNGFAAENDTIIDASGDSDTN